MLLALPLLFASVLLCAPPQAGAAEAEPLLFPPEKNGARALPIAIDIDLSAGDRLRVGPREFAARDFTAKAEGQGGNPLLSLAWRGPESAGQIELVDEKGAPLASQPFKSGARPELAVPASAAQAAAGKTLRLCVSHSRGPQAVLTACSSSFHLRPGGALAHVTKAVRPKLMWADKAVPLTGRADALGGTTAQLTAVFTNGSSLQIVATARPLKITDVVTADNGKWLVRGEGDAPQAAPVTWLRQRPTGPFSATMGAAAAELVWQAEVDPKDPVLYAAGDWDLPFRQELKFAKNPPAQKDRPTVDRRGLTYSETFTFQGRWPPHLKLAGGDGDVRDDGKGGFSGSVRLPKRGSRVSKDIQAQASDGPRVAALDVYRGVPFEFSGRLNMINEPMGTLAYLAEVSVNAWFDSLFASENSAWDRRRWGVSGKYGQVLGHIGTPASGTYYFERFSVATAELRYNLVPGLASWDETVGVLAGARKSDLNGMSSTMAGAGVYWARSLPRAFDDLFNLVPFMRHPKWVDAEFIYYPVSVQGAESIGPNWALNFHGKVFWSPVVFGEAGFGVRTYAIREAGLTEAQLMVYYGTLGLGWYF